ncbi:MAG: right-handed parallel beta-helix repeat-containing protein [Bacteroidetes bacterium]|nr:right-handed parallel beta-helix repeat-containing protein [Bacteroidota bacterium]
MKHRFASILGLVLLCLATLHQSCQKERFTTDPKDVLAFSSDTLRFDTVFTSLGSATRLFKIYNRHHKSIRISHIFLENGAESRFNLNIDGIAGNDQRNLEIAPNDSMYVFAEVTVNPNDPPSISPFVVHENIVFETNGQMQKVVLEAFGQNAVYLPSRYGAGGVVGYSCNGGEWVWDDPRPYVLYGVLVIDNCTVRIPAGARIYTHGGLAKAVDPATGLSYRYNDGYLAFIGNGKLIVEGSQEKPVIFEDDRLEKEFDKDAGQWTGIWLQPGTRGHQISHCIIRNSIIGIRVDSAADLTIRNSQIYNTASSGLLGVHATITAENCLFYRNTGYSMQFEYGGNYTINYCTATSYGVDGEALKMGNVRCYNENCDKFDVYKLTARFKNCIFTGSKSDQITLLDRVNSPLTFDYKLENCVVRVQDLPKPNAYPDFFEHCQPCLNVKFSDILFVNINEDDFHLDTLKSVANRYALPIQGIDKDLDGKNRDAVQPDAGCYEIEF